MNRGCRFFLILSAVWVLSALSAPLSAQTQAMGDSHSLSRLSLLRGEGTDSTQTARKSLTPWVEWGLTFDFFFDNREYKSQYNWPQTLFGARIAPELGVAWQGGHSIMVGVSMLANFGAEPFVTDNEVFAYYQYNSEKFNAYAGVVPRNKMIGSYSRAFFSDSVYYFDPNLSGLLLQRVGERGYFEFGADWNSIFAEDTREKFLLFSAGQLMLDQQERFYVGYNFNMYHHAGNYTQDGVVDNVLIYPFVGVDFATLAPKFEVLDLQVGWINAFQNDRKYVNEYVTPGGVQVDACVQRWGFGIYNTLYAGDGLMPYYVEPEEGLDYGNGLYWGEPFYRSDLYNRLEFYWQAVSNQWMNLRLSSVHHYDGSIWGWQQKITFSLNLGQRRLLQKR